MRNEIERFRKLCDILIKEKNYTVHRIAMESKLSPTVITKFIKLHQKPL